MLIPFTDAEGRETWINPIHVKVVRTRKGMLGGAKGAEVWFSWAAGATSVNIADSPEAVAMKLNAGLAALPPGSIPLNWAGEDEDDGDEAPGKSSGGE